MGTRVLIADDYGIMREGIRSLLEKQTDMEVAGEADNGRVALQLTSELLPDVVLMDLDMPDMNGVEATRQIVSQFPGSRVLIFSADYDRQTLLEALRAGAKGLIMKCCASIEEIVSAIRIVADGRNYLSPAMTESIFMDYNGLRSSENPGRS
jgi:two-component system response regulator DegU